MEKSNIFDSTICFTMMGSWLDAVYSIEEYYGSEVSMKLVHMIDDYCRYGIEPVKEEMGSDAKALYPVWLTIQESAKHSVARRKSHFNGNGLTEKQKAIIDAYRKDPNKPINQIATELNISWGYVNKTIKDHLDREAPKQEPAIPYYDDEPEERAFEAGVIYDYAGNEIPF